jgi:hypothetical protein
LDPEIRAPDSQRQSPAALSDSSFIDHPNEPAALPKDSRAELFGEMNLAAASFSPSREDVTAATYSKDRAYRLNPVPCMQELASLSGRGLAEHYRNLLAFEAVDADTRAENEWRQAFARRELGRRLPQLVEASLQSREGLAAKFLAEYFGACASSASVFRPLRMAGQALKAHQAARADTDELRRDFSEVLSNLQGVIHGRAAFAYRLLGYLVRNGALN